MLRANTMPHVPPARYPSVSAIPPTPATVVNPIQPVPTSTLPLGSQPNFALPQPILQPPSPMEPGTNSSLVYPSSHSLLSPSSPFFSLPPLLILTHSTGEVSPYSVAECPRCHKVVSTLGANLWLHLKECDPDHIMDYVRLLHEGKLATPTLTEKEKSGKTKREEEREEGDKGIWGEDRGGDSLLTPFV